MHRIKGLRRRWLLNTLSVLTALGLVSVMAVVATFAANYYSAMESDMRFRARTTTEFFADYMKQDYNEYYQSCITYAKTFEDRNSIELQFINAKGRLVASSYGEWAVRSPTTPEISAAVSSLGIRSFVGRDPVTGERIMAVSSPMIYSNGEVIGVLRYVTSTALMDRQIAIIGTYALIGLLVVLLLAVISSNYYIHSILVPMEQITEKAKRITGGSYGIQIETKYDDEIGVLAETINEMSNQISQNERMQAEFISSLSHELRTPLTAITGWSETLLGSEELDENAARGMKIILREAERLTGMVEELLDFTRLQDGRTTLNMELTDIRSEFEDTVFMYGSRLAQEGIRLEYEESDAEIPEISCDPRRLRQVFLNILDNAAKHGGSGKRIDASVCVEGDTVAICIRDYGPGIAPDELPLVKKKFYKGGSKARGSGIGLAVCEEIVRLHDGSLDLENAPGGGTQVTIRLPVSH